MKFEKIKFKEPLASRVYDNYLQHVMHTVSTLTEYDLLCVDYLTIESKS